MGVSIYYTASRPRPLTPVEQSAINAIEARYPVEALIAECGLSEAEFNGEGFDIYPKDVNTEPEVVFEGATKLPLYCEDAMRMAVQYWCRLLSEVRRALPDATWEVHIDDHTIAWIEDLQAFDPSA